MKPKPTLVDAAGHLPRARGRSAPSASSTSAEPHWLVAERLPCLATRQPAPAAMRAAVVDTLKVGRPAAGAGRVDEVARPRRTGTASSRIVRASPAISWTVSPFVRSAIRKAAVCASEASPSMISRSTRAASSAHRSSPPARRSIASVRTGCQARKLRSMLLAVGREHRLRVELHALDGQLAVAQAHDHVARASAERSRPSGRSGSTTSEW